MKNLIIIICTSLILFSCKEELSTITSIDAVNQSESDNTAIDESNLAFAQIIAKAMQDKDIREFVKNEAARQIDKDYDVIYQYVKDFKLNNGKSFRENLADYCSGISYLDEITNNDLTLSILVPDLSDDFSAEKWDTGTQIPVVAYRNVNIKKSVTKLKTFDSDGNEFEIERYVLPSVPTVVVKSNERLISTSKANLRASNSKSIISNDGVSICFLDDAFNNLQQGKAIAKSAVNKDELKNDSYQNTQANSTSSNSTNREIYYNGYSVVDKKNMSLLQNHESNRDFVYYDISIIPTVDRGTLNTRYHEHITSIQFNSPLTSSHVIDLDDASLSADWSDGSLELVFDFIFLSNNSAISNVKKMMSVSLDDLFIRTGSGQTANYTGTKKFVLPTPIEIFNWDIYTYGDRFKIIASEYDPGTVTEHNASISSTFGTNFEVSIEVGIGIVKIGSKHGTATSTTDQSSTKINSTNNSDLLGEVIVNFFDPIYINQQIHVTACALDLESGADIDEINYTMTLGNTIGFSNFENSLRTGDFPYIEDNNPVGEDREFIFDIRVYNIPSDPFIPYTYNTGMVTLTIEPCRMY